MTSGQGGRQDISDRVARGFEELVESEQASVARAAPVAPAGGPDRTRVVDELKALVRDELETMRLDLQAAIAQATDDLANERQELRAQIAKTVGAANKWFVKARDQLVERLDEIAAVASKAEQAASAAAGAAASGAAPADAPKRVDLGKRRDLAGDGDDVFEWDVDDDARSAAAAGAPTRAPATVDLAIESEELDALMDPVRGDIQELQGEISAMGQAVADLRAEVATLVKRVPGRPKPVRLDERDIDVIIEAVLVAMAPPPPPRKAAAKKAPRTTAR